MANKNMLNVVLSLKDRFTKPLKKTTQNTKNLDKELRNATKRVKAFGTRANSSFKKVTSSVMRLTGVAGMVGTALSFTKMTSYLDQCAEKAKGAQVTTAKLTSALRNNVQIQAKGVEYYKEAKKHLEKEASSISKSGVISAGIVKNAQQQLATYGLSEETIIGLSSGMADMLAKSKGINATSEDGVAVAKALGKAFNGSAGSLSKMGIVLNANETEIMKNGTEAQKLQAITSALERSVAGANAELANTDAGKIKQAENQYAAFQTTIGQKVLPLKGKIAALVTQYLPSIQEKIVALLDKATANFDPFIAKVEAMKPKIVGVWNTVKSVGGGLLNALKPFFNFLLNKPDIAIKGLIGIGGAFGIVNTAIGVVGKITVFKQGIKDISLVTGHAIKVAKGGTMIPKILNGITGGVKLLTTAIKANPIGFIISLVIAVIGWLVHLYKTNETFRNKVNAVFAAVKNAVVKAVAAVKAKFDQFKQGLQQIKDKVVSMKNSVANAFQAIHDKISSVIGKIKDKIQGLLDKLNIFKRESTDSSMSSGLDNLIGKANAKAPYGRNALGTSYWKGGLTSINEGGRGEIVNLPNGTQVIPHDVAKKSVGGTSISVQVVVQGNVIGNEAFANQMGNIIAKRLAAAAANS